MPNSLTASIPIISVLTDAISASMNGGIQMKRHRQLLVAAVFTVASVAGLSSAAFAGEVNGKGEPIQINARSECAFSGLEDHPVEPGTTQNWGSISKAERDFLRSIGVSPETLCNGHLNPIK